jgi:hypothetical protein
MELCIGFEPTAVRQTIDHASHYNGVLPKLGADTFDIADFTANRYDYGAYLGVPPVLETIGDDGGVFRFPAGAVITEVRMVCGAGSTMDIFVEETDGTSSVQVVAATASVANRYVMIPEGLPVLPSQQLRFAEVGLGAPPAVHKSITVYAVKRGRMP